MWCVCAGGGGGGVSIALISRKDKKVLFIYWLMIFCQLSAEGDKFANISNVWL